jgi:hypothetical protein
MFGKQLFNMGRAFERRNQLAQPRGDLLSNS